MKIMVTEGRDIDISLEGHEGGISIRWFGAVPDVTLHLDTARLRPTDDCSQWNDTPERSKNE
jgi:hypothetical protein